MNQATVINILDKPFQLPHCPGKWWASVEYVCEGEVYEGWVAFESREAAANCKGHIFYTA